MKNKNKWKPDIRPEHTETNDHIASCDPAKKAGDDRKGKYQQHDRIK
jgi:hypothetical protein